MSDPVIHIRGLKTQFGSHVVHENLDLEVERGETIGVIGPSGCGKSVLLNQIVGLLQPAEGDIEVFGHTLNQLSSRERHALERRWAVMFQDGALFSNLTVRENVMAPMREHTDLSLTLMKELADLKVLMAGLTSTAVNKRPSELSGGMRKRAALARALALDPELLFLDEPTAGLDPITAGRFDELVRELSKTLGLTVFLVTHDLDTLKSTCDRIAVILDKHIKYIGPLQEIARIDDPWIKEYFSGPRGRAVVD
ncbi:ABC transporter ATP-binding protein [Ponticaulis profundi]|uniref:ABC transporter ATP-binding protein n=1 Tax=Ponticaulis profundi TaxID=2665222 RepID=A0ABW1S624_9PROT